MINTYHERLRYIRLDIGDGAEVHENVDDDCILVFVLSNPRNVS